MAADADGRLGNIEARIQEVYAVLQQDCETLNATSATAIDIDRRKAEEIAAMIGEQIRIFANTAETTPTMELKKAAKYNRGFGPIPKTAWHIRRGATEKILVRLENVSLSLGTKTNKLSTMSKRITADLQTRLKIIDMIMAEEA